MPTGSTRTRRTAINEHGPRKDETPRGVAVVKSKLAASVALVLALGGSSAIAQELKTSGGTSIHIRSSARVHARNVKNAGSLALTGGRLFVRGNLDNTGSLAGDNASQVEFNGTLNQRVSGAGAYSLGRVRCNNDGAPGADAVSVESALTCFKADVAVGTLRIVAGPFRVLSSDTTETDPMVAVRPGAALSISTGVTVKLGGGALIVQSQSIQAGRIELVGSQSAPAMMDADNISARYSFSVRGRFLGSWFKISNASSNGLEFRTSAGALPPVIAGFQGGTFDRPPAGGTLIDLAKAVAIRIDVNSAGAFEGFVFDNSGGATDASNCRTSASTRLLDATGAPLDFVSFKEATGALSGEAHDDEPFGANLIRWSTRPSPPTNLGQFRSDGATAIGVGAITDENVVVLKATIADPEADRVRLEAELDLLGSDFDGVPSASSGLVASGSEVALALNGLILGSYHWRVRTVDESGLASDWVSFGANAETQPDFRIEHSNLPPTAPTGLDQFKADTQTPIAIGGDTNETSVVFKGTVADENGDPVRLQVEVKRLGVPFNGQSDLVTSSLVASGSEASATVSGLGEFGYRWRARTLDDKGHASAWVSFGGNPDTAYDFRVAAGTTAPVITTPSKKTNDNTPKIEGTAPADSSIEVFANGALIASTTAGSGGAWSVSASYPLQDGPYSITARATVGGSTSPDSAPVVIVIDTTPPPPPEELFAVPLNGTVVLKWTASEADDVAGYVVYRRLVGAEEWTRIIPADEVIQGTFWIDRGLVNGEEYEYRVTAVDDALDEDD